MQGAAASGLGAAAQALSLAGWERAAFAAQACNTSGNGVWGDLVGTINGNTGNWTCGTYQGVNVLDIYAKGGGSQYETFWLSGLTTNSDFQDHFLNSTALGLGNVNWSANTAFSPCNGTDLPTPSSWYHPFAQQAPIGSQTTGDQIYWGPAAKPLWSRLDILNRCHMVTLVTKPSGHDFLVPHEAAVPYSLTGLTLDNTRICGTGSAFQDRVQKLAAASNQSAGLPSAYVLYGPTGGPLAPPTMIATGEHPGSARPVLIQVQNTDDFYNNLARSNVTKPEADQLYLALRHDYRSRLLFQGAEPPVRSAHFDEYWAAAGLLTNAPAMQSLFANGLLKIDQQVKICPTYPGVAPLFQPGTKTMIQAAASLLAGPARYVGVIDSGLARDYDTHGNTAHPYDHVLSTCANFFDTLKHLADNIYHPTVNPTGLLNLDNTMIVLTTEFGRTSSVINTGREHNPQGVLAIIIGGRPPTAPTITGAIDQNGNTVPDYQYCFADLRAAMLLAGGIDPFAAPGNFREADFSDALKAGITGTGSVYQAGIRDNLKRLILGL